MYKKIAYLLQNINFQVTFYCTVYVLIIELIILWKFVVMLMLKSNQPNHHENDKNAIAVNHNFAEFPC